MFFTSNLILNLKSHEYMILVELNKKYNMILNLDSKRNQQKRVVEQVNEENLLSDAWAWRKYGQKPIKGSPYPRS